MCRLQYSHSFVNIIFLKIKITSKINQVDPTPLTILIERKEKYKNIMCVQSSKESECANKYSIKLKCYIVQSNL